ncbi:MAG: helix-turn-helix transcriptional regulator [Saprospiraceae bacterium]
MARSKYQFGRLQIIDRELRKRDRVKTKDLKKIIEAELSIKVDVKTIQEDLKAMKDDSVLGYYAPIEYDTRSKSYYYTDRSYTIRAFGLKEDEIQTLLMYAQRLKLYSDYGLLQMFSSAMDKVLNAVAIQKNVGKGKDINLVEWVQFEEVMPVQGSEYIPIIADALENRRKLQLTYRKFQSYDIASVKIVAPHLLKEYENRWYMIAYDEEDQRMKTYALDRIEALMPTNESFELQSIDFQEHFKYSMGITINDMPPQEIILAFDPIQGMYVKSLPLHHSQKVLKDNELETIISINVKPTYEFYAKILSFGNSVKIVSPAHIAAEVKNRLAQALKNYEEDFKGK